MRISVVSVIANTNSLVSPSKVMSATPLPSAPSDPSGPCAPCGPSGPCGPCGPCGPTRFISRLHDPPSRLNRSPLDVFRNTSPSSPMSGVGSLVPLKNSMPSPPAPPPAIGNGLSGDTYTGFPFASKNFNMPLRLTRHLHLCPLPSMRRAFCRCASVAS